MVTDAQKKLHAEKRDKRRSKKPEKEKEKEETEAPAEPAQTSLAALTADIITGTRSVVSSVLEVEANSLISENSNPEFSALMRASMKVLIPPCPLHVTSLLTHVDE